MLPLVDAGGTAAADVAWPESDGRKRGASGARMGRGADACFSAAPEVLPPPGKRAGRVGRVPAGSWPEFELRDLVSDIVILQQPNALAKRLV